MRIKEMTPEELRSLESATPMQPDLNLDEADYTGVPTVTNGELVTPNQWADKLQTNKYGSYIKSSYNLSQIVHHDEDLAGLFTYNELSDKIYMTRDFVQYKKGYNIESVETAIAVRISKIYGLEYTSKAVYEMIVNEAFNSRFNPAQDYFNEAYKKYDGKKRLDTFFIEYLGADDSEITRKMTRIFFEGLVMKVKNPFIKFDRVLDLVGGQGVGKTWIMNKLGGFGRFYTDEITSFEDKDSLLEMTKNIIVNDDEMAITNKTSFESLKAFISKSTINVRKAYARSSRDYGKGFVIVRSTNNLEYLRDKTGNRRFMTMTVDSKKKTKDVKDLTEDEVLQVIGEATHLFGHNTKLTQDELLTAEELEEAQTPSQYITPEEEAIREYLAGNPQIKFISTRSLVENALDVKAFSGNSSLGRKVSYYMNNMGGWSKTIKKINGVATRGYERG